VRVGNSSPKAARAVLLSRPARNLIVVEILRDYGYVDARGMGVRTKVIPALRAGGVDRVFEATDEYVKSTIEKIKGQHDPINQRLIGKSAHKGTSKEEKDAISGQTRGQSDLINDLLKVHGDLLNAIRANPYSGYQALAHNIQVSEATVKRHIQKLKRAGILLRKGSRKTGYWEIVEP